MLTESKAIELLDAYGAVRFNCHCVSAQGTLPGLGDHRDTYISEDLVPADKELVAKLAKLITRHIKKRVNKPGIVLAPADANTLGTSIAGELDAGFGCFEEKHGRLVLAHKLASEVCGKRVMLVQNVLDTGTIVQKAETAIRSAGGKLIVIGCILHNEDKLPELRKRIYTAIRRKLESWTPRQCLTNGPCSAGIPIDRYPGHGASLERLIKAGQVRIPPELKLTFR